MAFDSNAIRKLYPTGSHGGQCVIFCRKLLPDLPYGLLEKWKKRKVLESTGRTLSKEEVLRKPFVGLMIVTDEGYWGHVAVINEVLKASKVKVSESNYALDEKVGHDRIVNLAQTQLAYGWVSRHVRPEPGEEEGRKLADWEERARQFGLEIGMKNPEGVLDSPWTLLETLRKYHEYAKGKASSSNLILSGKARVAEGIHLNVRATPSPTAAKIGLVSGREALEVLAQEGEWIKIRHKEGEGFVHRDFVEMEESKPVTSTLPSLNLLLKAKAKMKKE